MSDSTQSPRARKAATRPKKPYPGFPLTPHPGGVWCKKIKGRLHYFGNWARRVDGKLVRVEGDGWKEAEAEYNAVRDDLHAGRTPRAKRDGLTVADLCNNFRTAKLRKLNAGEMSVRTYNDYVSVCDLLAAAFVGRLIEDLRPEDFGALRATMAEKWGPVRLANAITRVKSVFKYGADNDLLERNVRFGSEFVPPDKAVLRKHKAKQPAKLFDRAELLALIDGAVVVGTEAKCNGPELVKPDATLRAMILLGLNCGFGNTDCADLMFAGMDLAGGWINFPRPKTGIERRCPLWPETIAAIQAVLTVRPKPADYPDCGRVFLSARGNGYIQSEGKGHKDLLAIQFTKLLNRLGIHRKGVGFYALRHTFRTVADGARDQPAADLVMGHTDPSMRARYVEAVDNDRLRAVVDHVRGWLWPERKPAVN